ncbi:eukaryotic translation initiation factor 3 subunit E [Ascosphaera acerosa]|nr:eukaryotic translation initiation factor 3 subunit E [Ascosphaera acerosa]
MADTTTPPAAAAAPAPPSQPRTAEELAREYTILPKLIPYLDRHLVFPLLEFASSQLQEQEQDDEPHTDTAAAAEADLTRAKYELLKQTNMTDYVANLWQAMHPGEPVPAEFAAKREAIMSSLAEFQASTAALTALLEDEGVVGQLRSDKVANLAFLEAQHGVTPAMVDALYAYGKFQYSCGSYANAAEMLYRFRVLSTDNDKVASATWGKLASEILTTNWEGAMEEVAKVREGIDTRLFANPLAQLTARSWLIHWCLFPYFNHPDDAARDSLTDLFFSPAYINTIQAACPWILRYLAAAVITARSRAAHKNASIGYQKQLKDLVRVVRQEGYEYADPLTDFVKALYVDFDFEEAQVKLREAEEILRQDFFLVGVADAFVEAARHLISESYCKIHQRIDIKYVRPALPRPWCHLTFTQRPC